MKHILGSIRGLQSFVFKGLVNDLLIYKTIMLTFSYVANYMQVNQSSRMTIDSLGIVINIGDLKLAV